MAQMKSADDEVKAWPTVDYLAEKRLKNVQLNMCVMTLVMGTIMEITMGDLTGTMETTMATMDPTTETMAITVIMEIMATMVIMETMETMETMATMETTM